jgi:hypothetical protein
VTVKKTVSFSATGHYSDGSTKNLTSAAVWTSSNTSLATIVSNTGVATGVKAGGPVTITAALSGISGKASLTVKAAPSTTVVTFNNPAPAGSPHSAINGDFKGINFGSGEWDWEGPYLSDSANNIYFNSASGDSRSFKFAGGDHVLLSVKVVSPVAGTLTLSDGKGQTKTQHISTGSMQVVTTGWKNESSTIKVTFTAGWKVKIGEITFQ